MVIFPRCRTCAAFFILLLFLMISCSGGTHKDPPVSLLTSNSAGGYDAEGNWMAWSAYDEDQLLVYNGNTVINLTDALDREQTPIKVLTDGHYVAFITNDGITSRLYWAVMDNLRPILLEEGPSTEMYFDLFDLKDGLLVWGTLKNIYEGWQVRYCILKMSSSPVTPLPIVSTFLDYRGEPRTDGRYIVWCGNPTIEGDQEISLFDAENPEVGVTQITDATGIERYVSFDDGVLAWEAAPADGGSSDLFAYVIEAGASPVRLTSNAWHDSVPVVKGGVVRWNVFETDSWPPDIFLCDVIHAPDKVIRVASDVFADQVASSGGLVAWNQGDLIYFYDLSEGAATAVPHLLADAGGLLPQNVDVDGQMIVFELTDGNGSQIYAYNKSLWPSTEVTLLQTNDYSHNELKVEDNLVTWVANDFYDPVNQRYALFAYDLGASAGSPWAIDAQDHHSVNQEDRTVLNGQLRAVWIASGNQARLYVKERGKEGDPVIISPEGVSVGEVKVAGGQVAFTGYDRYYKYLYHADLASGAATAHQVMKGTASTEHIDFDGTVIVWINGDGPYPDLYYYDLLNASPTPVMLSSSVHSFYPKVGGRILTWADDGEIYYAPVGDAACVLTENDFNGNFPDISEGVICWRGSPGEPLLKDLYCANVLDSPLLVDRITSNDVNELPPEMDDGLAFWTAQAGAETVGLYVYDPVLKEVSVLKTSHSGIEHLALGDGIVTWEQGQCSDLPWGSNQIVARYINGGMERVIADSGCNKKPVPGNGFLLWNRYPRLLYMTEME